MKLKPSERQVLETFDTFFENLGDDLDNQTAHITAAILTLSEKVSNNGYIAMEVAKGRFNEHPTSNYKVAGGIRYPNRSRRL